MLLTAHQTNYLPYLGFFEKIARSDLFLIVDNVQFVKRGPFGWIHRNKIRTKDGWQWLSLDCQTSGQYTQNIHDVALVEGSTCLRKHWRAIEVNYKRAPHFEAYCAPFREIYAEPIRMMNDLNTRLIKAMMAALEITTPVDSTTRLGITGESTGLIAAMCHKVGATRYLSGTHGKDYLDMALLEREQVKVEFQEYVHPVYPQCWPGDFQPYMCALDLIFNCGPKSLDVLMGR